jgi:hypothetical protein
MRPYPLSIAVLFAAVALSACGGSSTPQAPIRPTPTPTATAIGVPTPTPGPTSSAQPQVVHIGFSHTTTTDPTFGMVSFYTGSSTANAPAAVVHVAHGSSLMFTNDDSGTSHTASGLGSSGFPASFDNTGGTTQTGTTIDGGTTWSTGTLVGPASSVVFTVGPAGNYYFGCFYHYNDAAMRDVIVSQ